MDSKKLSDLSLLYGAVYNEEIKEQIEEFNNRQDPFYIAESLSEETLEEAMEELVYEIIGEGLDVDNLEEIFETVLLELNPYAPAGSKEAKAYNKSTTASKKGAERAAARDAAVSKVKGALKSAIGKVKEVKSAAKGAVKDVKQQSHVGLAKYASSRNLMPGAGLKTQSSKGRGELRSAVASDVASRAKEKVKKAGLGATSSAYKAGGAIAGSAEKTRQALHGAASDAKATVKKGIRGLALGVARRMKEDMDPMDVYSIVYEHLLDEGYASTEESAKVIMANMSESWIDEIVEASMSPADIERIAQQAAGGKKKTSSKLKSGMKEEYDEDEIDEEYKKLPVGKMMRKVEREAFKRGQQAGAEVWGGKDPDEKKLARSHSRTAAIKTVADLHDPKYVQTKERLNRIQGAEKK